MFWKNSNYAHSNPTTQQLYEGQRLFGQRLYESGPAVDRHHQGLYDIERSLWN
jgi:hypothetical protein